VARELTMPKLSDSMADAVIIRWLKSPGDAFARGDALIEVETDKATVVYEAESDGTLAAILVEEGATAAVGEAIATLSNGGGEARTAPPPPRAATREAPPPVANDDRGRPADGGAVAARPNATPVARRAAVELGVSLHGIAGTGPGGRVTVEDVRAAAGSAALQPIAREASGKGEVTSRELTPTEATIARRMVESATTTPVLTAAADVDVSLIVALRQGAREAGEEVPSLNDFVVKAVARTLREMPRFNSSYVDGRIETYSRVNVGIAVATDDGLLVPVVLDADRKSLAAIAAESRGLADAARRRALTPDELHHATFTVSNLGMFGVRSFTAIVDPPQAAILAVGGARREPREAGPDRVEFRDALTVTLTCDHRVVYGAHAAQFLSRLRELLERPLALTLGGDETRT
jgi:pyruvate dehydrogenase E2 component (dihydrolipoyllysine-residue acetyltransferase)